MDDIDTFIEDHTFVNNAMINEALGKFFDRGGRLVEDEEPTKVEAKPKPKKIKPMPTENELAKEVADQEWKKPEVKRLFDMSVESGKPSKKKSQAKIPLNIRVRSEHKLNPEEKYSFDNDWRIHG